MEGSIFILKIFFGLLFMIAGITHVIKPKLFKHFTPPFLPLKFANYTAGFLEFFFGLGLLFTNISKIAALSIFVLMIVFLPIHIWDYKKDKPAIGSKLIAFIRIPVQFLLMYIAYLIYKNS